MYKNIDAFIKALEDNNELIRVHEKVSTQLEITEIVDRLSKNQGKAILFENNETDFPVLINAYGSEKRMCMALGVETLDDTANQIYALFDKMISGGKNMKDKIALLPVLNQLASFMPKNKRGKGECQEVINMDADITKLPVLKCWPDDGGDFITLPLVHTTTYDGATRNLGMYRMQVFDKKTTGMHWHLHKNGAEHFEEYKSKKEKMPVVVTLGGDPVYSYCAGAPLPAGIDEYILAGFLRKKKVKMVKCITNDIRIPSDVDFVIEGYVDPQEELALEGPFGDHTGFYSLDDYYPKFHITCITHRKKAVYPATIVGIPPMEDEFLAKATERIFIAPIKLLMIPELTDMRMPAEGVFHNISLLQIESKYKGQGRKVIHNLWGSGQMMFMKFMIVHNFNIENDDYPAFVKHFFSVFNPLKDVFSADGPLDVLDHSSNDFAFGNKMGIDITNKQEVTKFDKSKFDINALKSALGDSIEIETKWLDKDLPVIIFYVDRANDISIKEINEKLQQIDIEGIKLFLIMDKGALANDGSILTWLGFSNVDPLRDCILDKRNYLLADSRDKKPEKEFPRRWPDKVLMDDKTIELVNNKWDSYGIGEFLESPSLRFKE